MKVGSILEDRRNRSPTTSDAGVCLAGQSGASNTGHNRVSSQSRNLSPHRQCDPIALTTLEEKEREKEILKARARRVRLVFWLTLFVV